MKGKPWDAAAALARGMPETAHATSFDLFLGVVPGAQEAMFRAEMSVNAAMRSPAKQKTACTRQGSRPLSVMAESAACIFSVFDISIIFFLRLSALK